MTIETERKYVPPIVRGCQAVCILYMLYNSVGVGAVGMQARLTFALIHGALIFLALLIPEWGLRYLAKTWESAEKKGVYTELNTPPPGKSFHPDFPFRQGNPVMQLPVVLMSLQGDFDNCREHLISWAKFEKRAGESLAALWVLIDFIRANRTWDGTHHDIKDPK